MVIVVLFVFPGFAVTRCSPNVEPSTSPGHWFCSQTVILTLPTAGCPQNATSVNGPTVISEFQGDLFSVHLFEECIEMSPLELNASIVQPIHGLYHVTVSMGGPGFWDNWWNWTTPDNQSGLQWRGNFTLALLVAD
jgi:hypothetical protein